MGTMIRISAVYRIRNLVNGKVYVGSTNDWHLRVKQHLSTLRRGVHSSGILQRAYAKYGEAAFVFEIVEIVEPCNLLEREQHYLDQRPAYNISLVAGHTRLGLKSSPEHCARMSSSLKGRISPMKGKTFSEEHKKKISESETGVPKLSLRRVPRSDETRRKIAAAAANRSEEMRERISRKLRLNHNPISNYNLLPGTKHLPFALHIRWHVNRHITKDNCNFCEELPSCLAIA
jgi:group I intron endonuclease